MTEIEIHAIHNNFNRDEQYTITIKTSNRDIYKVATMFAEKCKKKDEHQMKAGF